MEELSHDSVNRFLLRERYEPKDLFDEVKLNINLVGGTLSGDDTVVDKPHSDSKITELIGYYYSGRHHRELASFSTRQAQRQQQQLDRHDKALTRIEGAIANLTNRVDALTTSTTYIIHPIAQQAVQSERDRAFMASRNSPHLGAFGAPNGQWQRER
ncbi:hypothetical protein AMR41_30930 [Hapalosiphon sp. MRB220]|nr:hypothetical protein AMR41_30930 [Hapalosiphon sp. MRB220]